MKRKERSCTPTDIELPTKRHKSTSQQCDHCSEYKDTITKYHHLCSELIQVLVKQHVPSHLSSYFQRRNESLYHSFCNRNTVTENIEPDEVDEEGDDEITIVEPSSQEVSVLKSVFGLSHFRHNQLEIVRAVMSGQDVLVLMPTGYGKSLTFQLPAVLSDGLTLVVSPLLSLMRDQVTQLKSMNVRAEMLSSDQTQSVNDAILRNVSNNQYKLLYLTPERLVSNQRFREILAHLCNKNLISRLVIDEAHVVSKWGHDFRKDYRQLSQFRVHFPQIPIVMLTASATEQVQSDIIDQIGLRNVEVFKSSFNRSNLFYEIRPKETFDKTIRHISDFISTKHAGNSGIIYCLSRKGCDKVSRELNRLGHKTLPYHADLGMKERVKNYEEWIKGNTKIIVATVAFGLGIDMPSTRFVIHHSFPKSLEDYYQETGRAGRDGIHSDCILYYSTKDRSKNFTLISNTADEEHKKNLIEGLNKMVLYCESLECRRSVLLGHFGERFSGRDCDKQCDNCKRGIQSRVQDVTQDAINLIKIVKSTGNITLRNNLLIWRGSNSKYIKDHSYDQLAEYGSAKYMTEPFATRIANQLTNLGYLVESQKTAYQYSYTVISASAKTDEILNDGKRVTIDCSEDMISKNQKQIGNGPSFRPLQFVAAPTVKAPRFKSIDLDTPQIKTQIHSQSTPVNTDSDLSVLLTAFRSEIANEAQIHPHLVFTNLSLKSLVSKKPTTLQALAGIPGISANTINLCGNRMIDEISAFLECNSQQFTTLSDNTVEPAEQIQPAEIIPYLSLDHDEDEALMALMTQ